MFFIAAALVLVTAGVFAGKAKFADASALYLGTTEIVTTPTTGHWSTVTGTGYNLASLNYGTNSSIPIYYDQLNHQVYFKP